MMTVLLPISGTDLFRILFALVVIEAYAQWRRRHAKHFWSAAFTLLLVFSLTLLCLRHL